MDQACQNNVLHKHYKQAYGKNTHGARVDVALRLLKRSVQYNQHTSLRLLDVGGGDMQLARLFTNRLQRDCGIKAELEGWDISQVGVERAIAAGEKSRVYSICDPVAVECYGQYDIVLFFEVLEHLVDTDAAIQNLRKLLKHSGWLLLSTPNLAGWMERLSLLAGMQPHLTEVSFVPYRFGNPLARMLIKYDKDNEVSAGHLRVFTLRALKEFMRWHGIIPVRVGGCVNHSYDFISRMFARWLPGLVGDVVVLGRPVQSGNKA